MLSAFSKLRVNIAVCFSGLGISASSEMCSSPVLGTELLKNIFFLFQSFYNVITKMKMLTVLLQLEDIFHFCTDRLQAAILQLSQES